MHHSAFKERVLLTGVSGYVGGRLILALERRGIPVRCLVRNPSYVRLRVGPTTEVVQGDVLDDSTLPKAMEGIHTAYYLIHSMGRGMHFEEEDRHAAHNFGHAAKAAGVRRIIYLGALGDAESLSPHLASRQEVGQILRDSGVPTLEFRASIIIGSGSLSFEMIRALVQKLPIMLTPRWVRTQAQPIAIEDVIGFLMAALELSADVSRVFEIGGADRASYMDLMCEYARQRGLKRYYLPVPFLTPWLSGLWLGLVTPLQARVGRKLIEGVRNATVVRDPSALEVFSIRPCGMREAMSRALSNEDSSRCGEGAIRNAPF